MTRPRRWDAGNPTRREDQFVRPPSFRDEHDSSHLSADAAAWHGSGSRQVALAAVLAVAAAITAVAFMVLVAPGGADVGPQAPLGAEGGAAPADPLVDPGELHVQAPVSNGNATTTAIPLPRVPVP